MISPAIRQQHTTKHSLRVLFPIRLIKKIEYIDILATVLGRPPLTIPNLLIGPCSQQQLHHITKSTLRSIMQWCVEFYVHKYCTIILDIEIGFVVNENFGSIHTVLFRSDMQWCPPEFGF